MREGVFRTMSGLLAAALVWFLATGNHAGRPVRELIGFGCIATVFAVFAVSGSAQAHRLLDRLLGNSNSKRPPSGDLDSG